MTVRIRAENRDRLLGLIKQAGPAGTTTEALARQAGMTTRAALSLCRELQQGQLVVAANGGRHAGGRPVIWRELVAPTPLAQRFAFRPLRTPRPTVIPVRAGGRLAPQVHNDAAVSMGRFTPNEYCPTKELFAW